jgi:lysozyme family protein
VFARLHQETNLKDNFEACLAFTLKYEGGYVNNPRDPGGPTNLGVTIATLSHELGRKATVDDVKRMTRQQAASIYRKKFWNTIDGETLPRGVDAVLFDISVNSGPGRALQWDGVTHRLAPDERIRALDARRRGFWKSLRIFRTFGKGWMARENALLSAALKMATL